MSSVITALIKYSMKLDKRAKELHADALIGDTGMSDDAAKHVEALYEEVSIAIKKLIVENV